MYTTSPRPVPFDCDKYYKWVVANDQSLRIFDLFEAVLPVCQKIDTPSLTIKPLQNSVANFTLTIPVSGFQGTDGDHAKLLADWFEENCKQTALKDKHSFLSIFKDSFFLTISFDIQFPTESDPDTLLDKVIQGRAQWMQVSDVNNLFPWFNISGSRNTLEGGGGNV
jgi:hypothetical protein